MTDTPKLNHETSTFLKEIQFKDANGNTHFMKNTLANIKLVEEMAGMGLQKAFVALQTTAIPVYLQVEIVSKLTGLSLSSLEALMTEHGTNFIQARLLGLVSWMLGGDASIVKVDAELAELKAKEEADAEAGKPKAS